VEAEKAPAALTAEMGALFLLPVVLHLVLLLLMLADELLSLVA